MARPGGSAWTVAGTIAAGCILQLLLHARLADRGYFAKYTYFADRIVAGDVPAGRLGDLSPGYLWLVVGLRQAGFSPDAILVLQVVMSGAIAGLAARVPAAHLAAVLVLTSRTLFVNALEIEPESPFLLLETLGLALAIGAPGAGRSLGAGFAYGLAAAIRPVALLPLLGLFAWRGRRDRLRALPMLAGFALPLLVVVLVNRALTGSAFLMNPGTVFYEGCNPSANPCGVTEPRIVKDVEATLAEPDSLHVAYQIVASRAAGAPQDPRQTNEFWTSRAVAYARQYPGRYLSLAVAKARVAVGNHEVYDLVTQRRKAIELGAYPFLPFGTLFSLALAGAWLGRRDPAVAAVALQVAGCGVVPVAFYVITRQRNPLVAPLAVLAAVGIATAVRSWRAGGAAGLGIAIAIALAGTVATAIEGDAESEDRRSWDVAEQALAASRRSSRAFAAGDRATAVREAALAATWPTGNEPAVPPELLRVVALEELREAGTPARRFDLALALQLAGDWNASEAVMGELESLGYRPWRGNLATSSVAFYRARALQRLGRRDDACSAARRAAGEAPGDAGVLALLEGCVDHAGVGPTPSALLDALHDPFTAELARIRAASDRGESSRERLEALSTRIPEWTRPGREIAALDP